MTPRTSLKREGEFARFFLVGLFCFFLNLLVQFVSTTLLHWHYLWGVLESILLVNFASFLLNKHWTFRTGRNRFFLELGRYYVVHLGSFALNFSLMILFVNLFKIHYLLASVVLSILFLLGHFIVHKLWTFQT